MLSLCIQDLVTATNGTVSLGTMPPLGGLMAPVGRLVLPQSVIRKGDVVVMTRGWTMSGTTGRSCREYESNLIASMVYSRGALGLISTDVVPPWDGKFHLRVNQMSTCQRDLLRHLRDVTASPVVVVLDDQINSPVAQAIREKVSNQKSTDVSACEAMGDDAVPMWQTLAGSALQKATVVHLRSRKIDSNLALLRPTILVATRNCETESISRAIGLVGGSGILVLESSEEGSLAQELSSRRLGGWTTMNVESSESDIEATVKRTCEAVGLQLRDDGFDNDYQAQVA